jgi:hypothetical protein
MAHVMWTTWDYEISGVFRYRILHPKPDLLSRRNYSVLNPLPNLACGKVDGSNALGHYPGISTAGSGFFVSIPAKVRFYYRIIPSAIFPAIIYLF